jgi:hypothetical protein
MMIDDDFPAPAHSINTLAGAAAAAQEEDKDNDDTFNVCSFAWGAA